eukprot:7278312-Lingulodinium_polyedra.AAC.1
MSALPWTPSERVFFVFLGMPMGWSWAVFYCLRVMAEAVSAALRSPQPGVGGLLEDGRPAPAPAPKAP